jgi:hypothetical protein
MAERSKSMNKKIRIITMAFLFLFVSSLVEAELGYSEQQQILDAHNKYRAEVNVTPLKWSDALAAQAQECADYNAAEFLPEGRQKHCPKPETGQNIAQATSNQKLNLSQIVDLWGAEKKYFINGQFPSVSSTGSPEAVGHYTQLIWYNTTEVGCASVSAGGNDMLICDYSAKGNIYGMWVYNPPPPPVVKVAETNQFKNLRNEYGGLPQRNIMLETVRNRPVTSCYSISPV